MHKKICTHKKKFVHLRNLHLQICAQCRFVISAFGKIFALQICAFCARRFFAHLQICTFVFCTFADLCTDLCFFCADSLCICEFLFWEHARTRIFFFRHLHRCFSLLSGFCEKVEKVEISENVRFCPVGFWRVPENVRKKLTCSWVVHEWFLGQRVWQHRVAKVARICIN